MSSHPEWRDGEAMMYSWSETFDFDGWMKSIEDRFEAQAEVIASLTAEVASLKAQINDGSLIGTPPPGAFVPRNWRRYGV